MLEPTQTPSAEGPSSLPVEKSTAEPRPPQPKVTATAALRSDATADPAQFRATVMVRIALTSATLGLLSCLLLGLVVAFNLHDEPPFEDADLRSLWALPTADRNAGPGIVEALEMIPANYFSLRAEGQDRSVRQALSEASLGGFARTPRAKAGTAAEWESDLISETVEQILASFAPVIDRLDAACRLPQCVMPTEVDPDEWFSKTDEAWQLLHLRAAAAFARGDLAATAEADLAILRFTAHSIHGTNRLAQRTTTLAQLPLMLAPLKEHWQAGVFDGRADEFVEAFRRLDLDRADASEAIRIEYRRFRTQVLGAPEWLDDQELSKRGMAYLFHPQATLRTIGDYYRAAIDEGERTGRVLSSEPPTIHTGMIAKIWHGNGIGHGLLELVPLELDSIYVWTDAAADEVTRWIERLQAL